MASSASSSSRVNIARLVFFISIAILTTYIYKGFKFEVSTYKAFRSSRRVLSSISSVALGESTTTISTTTSVITALATETSIPQASDRMTGVARIPNDIFQYSLMSALKRGITSGGPPASRLTGYGSHGIGQVTGSLNDLLLLDSVPYELHDGKAKRITDTSLPFVMVTKYEPEYRARIPSDTQSVTLGTLRSVFASGGHGASGKNSYTPFSVAGRFDNVKVKGGKTLDGVKGTIFGIACPPWAQEISYKDIQCSFLAEDKVRGGRVEDFEIKEGEVYWAIGGRYHLGFPFDPSYQDMDLESKLQ